VNPSTAAAVTLVDELVRCGVREVVLAPGSRSAPLALALHAADAAGRARLHVRVDERSAGFLAVGMARTSGAPVAVLTTSGTAVANVHPAVLEASHAGLPLLVLSADRPARLRRTGANQTTDQAGLFGRAVRLAADLPVPSSGTAGPDDPSDMPDLRGVRPLVARCVAAATGARTADPGPVQLNLQLDDPLVPDPGELPERLPASLAGRPGGAPWTTVTPTAPLRAWGSAGADAYPLEADVPTVVVAGDGAGPPARVLAEAGGWPLLAEPTSGARTGCHALRCYRLLLDGELAGRVRRVVVFGHPTLSRPVMRLLARTDVEVVAVSAAGATWTDPGLAVSRVVPAARADGSAEPAWLESWLRADKAVSAAVDAVVDAPAGDVPGRVGPHQVARAVAAALPPEGLLVVGSSNPVRDLDLMASAYPVGERRKIIGNRGLAGIDGTVSTAVGAALARRSPRALAYVGDLTFVHDSNGLVLGPDEPRPDLTFVVANDDGGSIFAGLEQGGEQYAGAFERVFGTPHGTDLAALCAASATPHRRCDSVESLTAALAGRPRGIEVVEVPVDRAGRRALGRRLRAAADAALSAAGQPRS
jgi:2-succinyl-5-enolpyruvyl-6-hydroxy-3-cyclohexene-1-carboxylate synthase